MAMTTSPPPPNTPLLGSPRLLNRGSGRDPPPPYSAPQSTTLLYYIFAQLIFADVDLEKFAGIYFRGRPVSEKKSRDNGHVTHYT